MSVPPSALEQVITGAARPLADISSQPYAVAQRHTLVLIRQADAGAHVQLVAPGVLVVEIALIACRHQAFQKGLGG